MKLNTKSDFAAQARKTLSDAPPRRKRKGDDSAPSIIPGNLPHFHMARAAYKRETDDGGFLSIYAKSFAPRRPRLPKNIEAWPGGSIHIEAHIVSAAQSGRWTPQWWENEDWAERKIRYGGSKRVRDEGKWLLAALKNPPNCFPVLVIDHPIIEDAVGVLPHDLWLAPGDHVSITGTPYTYRGRARLAFALGDFRLVSSFYALPRTPTVRALSDPDETPRHYHQVALYELYGKDWPARVALDKGLLTRLELWELYRKDWPARVALDKSLVIHGKISRWKDRTKQRIYEVCVRLELERRGLPLHSIETGGA